MSERTVVRQGGSLKSTLNNENVFIDFEWTYELDEETKKYENLTPTSSFRSYILQEIERDYLNFGIGPSYSQEDTEGVKEWKKLKESNTESPGGKPLAFEKDGKKFIVISEIFNGRSGKSQVVFDKKWFKTNTSVEGFEPGNIKNWDRLHNELSLYENGTPSQIFDSLENHRISAIEEDSKIQLHGVNSEDGTTNPGDPASDINGSIGFKKSPPPPDGERPPAEESGPLGQTPQKVDQQEETPVPPQNNRVSQKSQSELVDLYYPIDLNTQSSDYLLIKSVAYKPAGGSQRDRFIRSQFPNDLTGGIFSEVSDSFFPDEFTETIGRTSRTKNDVVTIQNRKMKDNQELIFLPIPSNIQDGNSVSFGDNSLDALSAGLAGISGTAINELPKFLTGETDIEEFTNKIGNQMGGLTPTLRRRILDGLKAQAANLAGVSNVSFQSLLARETGGILNPNKELLFNGVSLRTFRFSFKFTPRSWEESSEVRQIIRRLKKKMAPKIGNLNGSELTPSEGRSGHFLQTPNVFELQYMKGKDPHPYLNYFKTCALTDMSMKYTGENTYSTYDDGAPTSMIMDLTFKELEPIYHQDYYLPYHGEPMENDVDNPEQITQSVGF